MIFESSIFILNKSWTGWCIFSSKINIDIQSIVAISYDMNMEAESNGYDIYNASIKDDILVKNEKWSDLQEQWFERLLTLI